MDVQDQYERTPLIVLSTRHSDDPALERQRQDEVAVQIAEYLLNHGANVHSEDNQRVTVLDHLATKNLAVMGEYLITQHPDIDLEHRDWEGSTSLNNAVAFRSLGTVEMLIRYGASLKTIDGNELTMLYHIPMYLRVGTLG